MEGESLITITPSVSIKQQRNRLKNIQQSSKLQSKVPFKLKKEIGEVVSDIIAAEPLKIPLPRTGQVSLKFSTSTSANNSNQSINSSSGSFLIKNKEEVATDSKCGTPTMFAIDSRPNSTGWTFNTVNGNKLDSKMKEKNRFPQYKASVSISNVSSVNVIDSSSHLFSSYREGTSSGFNSDLDDDSESPFDSSDLDSNTSSEPPLLWNFADYFANLLGNDWCVRIPQSFIEDEFNLFELPDVFKCSLTLTDQEINPEKVKQTEYTFHDLLDFIIIEDLTEDPILKISHEMLEDSILLYKLIHQRFIMTKAGLQAMWERFDQHAFGTCPRYLCHDQQLLPIGLSALPNKETARVYCLKCQDIYVPHTQKHSEIDGVAFGPSFAHFFIRTVLYSNETKAFENRRGSHDWQQFVPKLYGFRIFNPENYAYDVNNLKIRNQRPHDFA